MSSVIKIQPEEKKKATGFEIFLMIGILVAVWVASKYFLYKFYSANPTMAALSAVF